jgi:hypothetical protein
MEICIAAHRFADVVLQQAEFSRQYNDVLDAIASLTDERLIEEFEAKKDSCINAGKNWPKSLSDTINKLLDVELGDREGWGRQSAIFQDGRYGDEINEQWTLDFASKDISVEVAFNNAGSTAWNLIKPVLASELNHVTKSVQTKIGIVIVATQALKKAGGFDSAIGTYESFCNTYLRAMQNILTVPILIIGLQPPKSFRIVQTKMGAKNVGHVERF